MNHASIPTSMTFLLATVSGLISCSVDCDTSRWPSRPDGSVRVLYADSAADPAVADGSCEAPFSTLASAIEASAPGDAILAARGYYRESLTIRHSLSISGIAYSEGINGTVLRPDDGQSGIKIIDPGGGVPERVALTGLEIDGASIAAIAINGSEATVRDCRIVNTGPDTEGRYGYGILGFGGALVTVRDIEVTKTSASCMLFENAGGVLERNSLEQCRQGGIRLQGCSDNPVVVRDNSIQDVNDVGIAVIGTRATLKNNRIEQVTRDDNGSGDGIQIGNWTSPEGTVLPSSDVVVEGNVVSECSRLGILVADGIPASISHNTIQKSHRGGIWVQGRQPDNESVQIKGNMVTNNRGVGIGVSIGSRAEVVEGNEVLNTQPATQAIGLSNVDLAYGIAAFGKSRISVRNTRIQGFTPEDGDPFLSDILLDDPGSESDVADNTNPDGPFRVVIQNSSVTVEITDNTGTPYEELYPEIPFPRPQEADSALSVSYGAFQR